MRSWPGWQFVSGTAVDEVVVDVELEGVVVVEVEVLVVEVPLGDRVVVVVRPGRDTGWVDGELEQAAKASAIDASAGTHAHRAAVTNRSLRA
jgi:hypothetical protein